MDICELDHITNYCIHILLLVVFNGLFTIVSSLKVIPPGIITKSGLNLFASFAFLQVISMNMQNQIYLRLYQAKISSPNGIFFMKSEN